ncbi:MAG: ABC transporter substrate-binding protein [Oscillospiraceae bacterium]
MKRIKKQSKICFITGILSIGMLFTSCAEKSKTEPVENFVFNNKIAFIQNENADISIDFEKSNPEIKEKYETLFSQLSKLESLDNIAVGSTTTANILYEIGLTPAAAPESKSLNPELTAKQYLPQQGKQEGILNFGSALSPNIEAIVQSGIELFLISDALPKSKSIDSLKELGINIQPIYQSVYSDMFVILQSFKDTNKLDNQLINKKMTEMKNDLSQVQQLSDNAKDNKKNVALLQLMPESIYVNGGKSVLGKILAEMGMINIFDQTADSELNVEDILVKNPDCLIFYGMGLSEDLINKTFQDKFLKEENALSQLSAVKNENYAMIGGDNFEFIGSVDFNITTVMKQIAEKVYG